MTPVCFSLALHVIGLQIIFIFTNLDPNCIITLHPYSTFMFSKHFIYSILPLQQPCELTISSASCCFVRKLRLLCYARDQPSITWSCSSGAEMSSWPPDCPGLPPTALWSLGTWGGVGGRTQSCHCLLLHHLWVSGHEKHCLFPWQHQLLAFEFYNESQGPSTGVIVHLLPSLHISSIQRPMWNVRMEREEEGGSGTVALPPRRCLSSTSPKLVSGCFPQPSRTCACPCWNAGIQLLVLVSGGRCREGSQGLFIDPRGGRWWCLVTEPLLAKPVSLQSQLLAQWIEQPYLKHFHFSLLKWHVPPPCLPPCLLPLLNSKKRGPPFFLQLKDSMLFITVESQVSQDFSQALQQAWRLLDGAQKITCKHKECGK